MISDEIGVRSDIRDLLLDRGFGTVAGVFVGGCVERGLGSSFRAIAHAHTLDDRLRGWICVRSPKRLLTASGEPTRILRHEIAHTIAPKSSHGSKAFVAALASVGIHTDRYSRAGRNRIARSPVDGSAITKPCGLCGSTRSDRYLTPAGRVVCLQIAACLRRQADPWRQR